MPLNNRMLSLNRKTEVNKLKLYIQEMLVPKKNVEELMKRNSKKLFEDPKVFGYKQGTQDCIL